MPDNSPEAHVEAALRHLHDACRSLSQAELALVKSDHPRKFGFAIVVSNNLGSMLRNLMTEIKYGYGGK